MESHPPLLTELSEDQEERRLQVLRRYDILDTPPDGAFDRVTSLASRLFDVPIAIISLVDRGRIWFKSKQGVDASEIPRAPGLCASAILQNDAWTLTDARVDPRSMANPLVAGELGLRFYLGVPLRTWDGYNLGTLCVIDQKPREVSDRETEQLKDLASLVMDQMELRLTARNAVAQREMLLHELHHRVKNNLQILLSIVSLSERHAQSAETIEFVRAIRGRLLAVGNAHGAMWDVDSLDTGRTGQLLKGLTEAIASALGSEGEFVTQIEDHEVAHDVLMPLSLILNELLTNAIKYGQAPNAKVAVHFGREGENYELTIRDSGPGFRDGGTVANASGLSFVRALTHQLKGVFVAENDQGAVCSVTFPT